MSILWQTFHWFVTLLEVIGVVVAILVVGLLLAVIPLWTFGRLAGQPGAINPGSDELDSGVAGDESQIPPDDRPASSQ